MTPFANYLLGSQTICRRINIGNSRRSLFKVSKCIFNDLSSLHCKSQELLRKKNVVSFPFQTWLGHRLSLIDLTDGGLGRWMAKYLFADLWHAAGRSILLRP